MRATISLPQPRLAAGPVGLHIETALMTRDVAPSTARGDAGDIFWTIMRVWRIIFLPANVPAH
jgi:hypothetical protein